MAEFTPLEKPEGKQVDGKAEKASMTEVEKAKEAAEVQKYETEKVKAKQEAVFAENNIRNADELKGKLESVSLKEADLGNERYEWNNQKATEQSEIQKQKAEIERSLVELNKRAQALANREANAEVREQLVQEREALMNSVERQKLEETEKYNSLTEQLKRTFPKLVALIGENANVLIKSGFHKLGYGLWDEIETMEKWGKNDMGKHCETIVEWMKGEVEDCNKTAVSMSRNPKQYGDTMHNVVVDNLEKIYELLPVLKPEYLPKDEV